MNYYSFHIGDYRGATAHLSNEEDLCYRRLLDMCYDTEKPIPRDIPWVSRRIRVSDDTVRVILNDFFELKEDGWHNPKADVVISEYNAWVEVRKANGRKGGRPVSVKIKNNQGGSSLVPVANHPATSQEPDSNQTETILKANQKPETNTHKPRTKRRSRPLSPPPGEIVYPPELDTDEFKAVFTEFHQHRIEIGTPLTPTSLRNSLLRASDLGVEKAIPAIRAAMAAGYRQFYEQQQQRLKVTTHDHRSEKRSREFIEAIEVPDIDFRRNPQT